MAGRERNIRQEETGAQWSVESEADGEHCRSSRLFVCLSLGRGKIFLVAWLLCFSNLQFEPQYLSLGFYYLCYRLG